MIFTLFVARLKIAVVFGLIKTGVIIRREQNPGSEKVPEKARNFIQSGISRNLGKIWKNLEKSGNLHEIESFFQFLVNSFQKIKIFQHKFKKQN